MNEVAKLDCVTLIRCLESEPPSQACFYIASLISPITALILVVAGIHLLVPVRPYLLDAPAAAEISEGLKKHLESTLASFDTLQHSPAR